MLNLQLDGQCREQRSDWNQAHLLQRCARPGQLLGRGLAAGGGPRRRRCRGYGADLVMRAARTARWLALAALSLEACSLAASAPGTYFCGADDPANSVQRATWRPTSASWRRAAATPAAAAPPAAAPAAAARAAARPPRRAVRARPAAAPEPPATQQHPRAARQPPRRTPAEERLERRLRNERFWIRQRVLRQPNLPDQSYRFRGQSGWPWGPECGRRPSRALRRAPRSRPG